MYQDQKQTSFGYNFSFIADIRLISDTDGNITIENTGIQSILPNAKQEQFFTVRKFKDYTPAKIQPIPSTSTSLNF